MREAPTEFTIQQRFMCLLPSNAHDELISRGMRSEYTELDMLKNHTRVWLEGRTQRHALVVGLWVTSLVTPALRAGRVESSYSIDEGDPKSEQDVEEVPTGDELEGTWGGNQYEAEERSTDTITRRTTTMIRPATSRTLTRPRTLKPFFKMEIRVGAMRPIRQSFSMRVHPNKDALPADPNTAAVRELRFDTDVTVAECGWDTGLVSYEQLVTAFYEQYGSDAPPEEGALELTAIEALGIEEHARELWTSILRSQPLMIVGFSPEYIRSTALDIEPELHTNWLAQGWEQALIANRSLTNDITMSIHILDHRLERIGRMRRALEEEGTRRSLEREEFNSLLAMFSTRNAPSGPAPSSPPSYPGSPHDSDGYYPTDETHMLSRIRRDSASSTTALSSVSSLSASTPNNATGGETEHEEGVMTLNSAAIIAPSLPEGEIILRSVEVLSSRDARRVTTYVTPTGNLRMEHSALPHYHRLNPEFQEEHRQAMDIAITERAGKHHRSRVYADHWADWESAPEEDDEGNAVREINGFPDPIDGLFRGRGLIYHEGLASMGPEGDDENTWPGFRAQILAQCIEHLANIRRPRLLPLAAVPEIVGLMNQPTRMSKTIVCLIALIKIGNCEAYALFDSGSNTDSMTPEYTHGIGGVRIPLDEQVTLQLGCVGSRSKISYGTRAPVEFGGV
ncbi:hypothetical protein K438DRAFT_1976791 [Mycena galopus ATCC 62051]|nr:hypothetical protein K438DRAFT_1976791 [Mycena galopus ATCC 62051]